MTTIAFLLFVTAGAGDIQPVYDRIFGDLAKLDPARVAQVTQGKPGARHYFDNDADGVPDEVWFIDPARRHLDDMRPVLVRVVDEDGDLVEGGEPDIDSDLYIADWKADGSINVFCDYTDHDGDGDVDEMAFYFPSWRKTDQPEIIVWWGLDVGDDNLLWYDVGYTYRQNECQYRTHFGGDELFSAFSIGVNDPVWTPAWENPFVFYDHDHDGVTEEVIRIEGRMEPIFNVRYSFDADDDATWDNPRDFDVSITGHALPDLVCDPAHSMTWTLRGIPTGPFLSYHATADFSLKQNWGPLLLTWDENDLNIDGDDFKDGKFMDTQERWEGIIAKGTEGFKQVGGPSCGLYNKRYELRSDPGPIRVYYHPADHRLHLYAADRAWLLVDYDYDQKADAEYVFEDRNNDGYLDTWNFDADADGNPDDTWESKAQPRDLAYTWPEVHAAQKPALDLLQKWIDLYVRLDEACRKSGLGPDPIVALLENGVDFPRIDRDVRKRLASSNETARYYAGFLRDRAVVALKKQHGQPGFWAKFDEARGDGDLDGMRGMLEKEFELSEPRVEMAQIRAGILEKLAEPRVAWAQDWVPPNIGWESDVCAYRVYWGQFDFFGKTRPGLIMPLMAQTKDYHAEQDWGMDALRVGETCGLGGATLYLDGKAYPVYSPLGQGDIQWSKRLVAEEPDRIVIETTAEHAGPGGAYSVVFTCSAMAGKKYACIRAAVAGKPADEMALGIGITKLAQEEFGLDTQTGVMANWGIQDPLIGTIGLGVVFPRNLYLRYEDGPASHQVLLKLRPDTAVQYYVQGDWLNGRRFPRCPAMNDWMDELRAVAAETHQK